MRSPILLGLAAIVFAVGCTRKTALSYDDGPRGGLLLRSVTNPAGVELVVLPAEKRVEVWLRDDNDRPVTGDKTEVQLVLAGMQGRATIPLKRVADGTHYAGVLPDIADLDQRGATVEGLLLSGTTLMASFPRVGG